MDPADGHGNGKDRQTSETVSGATDQNTDFDGLETVYPETLETPETSLKILEPGALFCDRYKIVSRIGSGGMGVVYQAVDQLTERSVAIKLIKKEMLVNGSSADQLISEGILARDIRHENVVSVYDVGLSDDVPYVVMEFLEGMTLRQWHRQKLFEKVVDLPLSTVENIMAGIIDGVSQAHKAGIIHRDLKPENVMLIGDPEAGPVVVKVLDFGLARATQNRSQHFSGTARGTASYIAPEQLTHPGLETEAADIYAISKIFYELLVGSLPDSHWQAPSEFRDDVPEELDELINRGLSARPDRRPESAAQLKARMISALQKQSETPRPRRNRNSTHSIVSKIRSVFDTIFNSSEPAKSTKSHKRSWLTSDANPRIRIALCLLCIAVVIGTTAYMINSSGSFPFREESMNAKDILFIAAFVFTGAAAAATIFNVKALPFLAVSYPLVGIGLLIASGTYEGGVVGYDIEVGFFWCGMASVSAIIWIWLNVASGKNRPE